MTAWRPAPIRQDEISRDNITQKHGPGGQPASVTEIAEKPAAQARSMPRSFGDAIRRLFREVKEALTGKDPAPKPKPRKKRTTEDTGRAFLRVARKLGRYVRRGPVIQTLGLHEPELWEWNDPDAMYQASEEFQPADTNYLSPHL